MRIAARLTALAAVSLATAAHAQNLAANPGFELDIPPAAPENGWFSFGEVFVESDFAQQSGGFQACKMFSFDSPGGNFQGAVQLVPVTVGTIYKLSALVRNGNDLGQNPIAGDEEAILKIEWKDGSGTTIAALEERPDASLDASSTAGMWNLLEMVDQAPPGAVDANLVLLHANYSGVGSGGESWWDDVIFEVTSEETPTSKASNLLTNPGLETPTMDATVFPGWTSAGNAFNEGNDALGLQVLRGLGAAKLFQAFPEPPAANSSILSQVIPVTPGQGYRFSARARNGDAFNQDVLGANNRAFLKIVWSTGGEVENAGTGQIDDSSAPVTWHHLEVSGTAPAGATTAEVFVVHAYDGAGTEGGASWFDDLCFQEADLPSPPEIVAFSKAGNTATVTFASEDGFTYDLLKSTTLANGSFVPVTGQIGIVGTGADLMAADTASTEPEAFYLIEKNP